MRVSRGAIVAVVGVVAAMCSIAVRASGSLPALPPPPPGELAQFDYFLGNWQCDAWDSASVLGPAHKATTAITFERELGRHWVVMHWSEERADDNPHPWSLENAFAYEPAKKQFVYVSRDNTGAFAWGNSRGWDGSSLVIDGEYDDDAGQRAAFRDTYVKHSDTAFDFVTELKLGGQWSKDATLQCHKAP